MRFIRVRYVVLFWLCLFAALAYLHRSCIAVPAQIIKMDLDISDSAMAWVMSAFFWGYTIMQIPAGWLADRWGSRTAVFWFMLLGSLAMVLMGLTEGLFAFIVCRLLMGVAQAGLFPASVNSFTKWFPQGERGFPNGMLGSSMMCGVIFGNSTIRYMLQDFGLTWRQVFWLFGLPGLAMAAWFFWWFRDRPRDHAQVDARELAWIEEGTSQAAPARNQEGWGFWTPATLVLLFFICGQQFFRGAGNLFYFTWFPTFLQETRGVSFEEVGDLSSIPLLGMMFGSILGGRAMDLIFRMTGSKLLSRQGLAIAGMAVSAAFLVIPYWTKAPLETVLLMTASGFAAGMGGPAAYTAILDLGGKNVATIFSIMNMAGNLGASLAPNLVIWWKDRLGWNEVLFLQAGFFVGALLCWLATCWPGRRAR